MPKLSDLLTSLAKKAGVDLTDPKFADIMAATLEVPEDLYNGLERGLMNEEAAMNNTRIRSKLRAEVFNGVDSDFESFLNDFEIEGDVKTAILSEKKTVERIKKLASHLKEQSEKSAKAGDKDQAAALKKQVEELNGQIRTITNSHKTELDRLKADNEGLLTDFSVKSMLGTMQYALPEAMKQEEKVDTVFTLLKQELQQKGLKLVRENGNVRLVKDDGTDHYDEKNSKVELRGFIDGALAQRGLLKVSDPATPGKQGNGDQSPNTVLPGNQTPASHKDALSMIEAQIAEQKQAS